MRKPLVLVLCFVVAVGLGFVLGLTVGSNGMTPKEPVVEVVVVEKVVEVEVPAPAVAEAPPPTLQHRPFRGELFEGKQGIMSLPALQPPVERLSWGKRIAGEESEVTTLTDLPCRILSFGGAANSTGR